MIVFINNHKVNIFRGARVEDAVLAYSALSLKKVKSGQFEVVDRFGFVTSPDGPLNENQKIFIKKRSI